MTTVRFSELPQLDESKMNKQWIRYPRKRTLIAGRECLYKVQGEKSRWQVQADQLKVAFGLPQLGVTEVFDEELNQTGCAIAWHENIGHIAQVRWQDWATQENLRMLVRIGVFDGVIGNSDRVVSNVLVKPDGSLLPIDEGEQERFEWTPAGPMLKGSKQKPALWVKYRKQLLALISVSVKDRRWLDQWVSETSARVLQLQNGTLREYYSLRLARLDVVVAATLEQILA